MKLIHVVKECQRKENRRLIFPLGIFSAAHLRGTTLRDNFLDESQQIETVKYAIENISMDFVRTVVDLVTEVEAMGASVKYPENELPSVKEPIILNENDIEKLNIPNPYRDGRLPFQLNIIREVKKYIQENESKTKLFGSLTGPFTCLAHLIGTSEATIKCILEPDLLHKLLRIITNVLTDYGKALKKEGADVIFVAEPLASVLSPQKYWEFSGVYCQEIIKTIEGSVILHISGDTSEILEKMCRTGAEGLSLDETVNIPSIIDKVPDDIVVIGNISSVDVLLKGNEYEIEKSTTTLLNNMMAYPNYILSTGCALALKTSKENITTFIRTGLSHTAYNEEITLIFKCIKEAVIKGDKSLVEEKVTEALRKQINPLHILEGCLISAINQIGELYKQNIIFIPGLLMASEAMYEGLNIIRPHIVSDYQQSKGTVLIGTVKNDLHDIGKNLVAMMLESNFINVINLGKNILPEEFIEKAITHNVDIIALSALTTTTMEEMEVTIMKIRQNPKLSHTKIIVGGAPITQEFADKIGADGFSKDAADAVKLVQNLLSKKQFNTKKKSRDVK